MITVDCCCCFDLKTAGLIIGWIELLINSIIAVIAFIVVCVICVWDCENFEKLASDWKLEPCSTVKEILIFISVIFIVAGIGFAYTGWLCIRGTKTRNYSRLMPMMVSLTFFAFLSLIQALISIIKFEVGSIIGGLVCAAIKGYLFVVIYSLYDLLRQESKDATRQRDRQVQQPVQILSRQNY